MRSSNVMPAVLAALDVPAGVVSRKWAEGRVPPELAAERSWQVVEDVFATATFEPGMFRLLGVRGTVDPSLYLDTELAGGILRRTLRSDVLRHELDGGSTLTINGVDRLDRRIQDDRELLEYAVEHLAWCNAFISHSATSSFGRHHDGHDTLILQAAGRKQWRIFEPGSPAPDPVVRILEPGDVLRVPAGWDHEVTGIGEASLHWTFGFVVPTEAELIAREATRAVGGGAGRDEVEALTAMSGPDLHSMTCVRTLARRQGANLPAVLSDSLDLAATDVRWASRLPPVVEVLEDRVKVGSLGKRLDVDVRLAGPVQTLAAGGRHLARDLVGGAATEAVVTRFLAWAVEQRLVLLETAQ